MLHYYIICLLFILQYILTCSQDINKQIHLLNKLHIIWCAPFYSSGGYSSEAFGFLKSFIHANISISIKQHGDSYNHGYYNGLSKEDKTLLKSHEYDHKRTLISNQNKFIISICHSEPVISIIYES